MGGNDLFLTLNLFNGFLFWGQSKIEEKKKETQ